MVPGPSRMVKGGGRAGLHEGRRRPGISAAEIETAHALVVADGLARAVEAIPAELEDVGIVGDLEGLGRVLLDHEDGLSGTAELLDDLKDLPEDERGQSERRLVKEHEARLEEEAPAHL